MPSGAAMSRGAAVQRWVPPLALAAALSALLGLGVFGLARHGFSAMDLAVFQAAGRTWLVGENPYDRASLDRHFPREGSYLPAFASPPVAAPFYMALALVRERTAMGLVQALDLLALALLAWLTARM